MNRYRLYSTPSSISGDGSFTIQLPNGVKRILSRDFIEWFRGFTDGEGAFLIGRKEKYYSFTFAITLHMDDVYVLNYICETLGIGSVYVYTKINHAIFQVRAQEEIQIIIDIFTISLKYNQTAKSSSVFYSF